MQKTSTLLFLVLLQLFQFHHAVAQNQWAWMNGSSTTTNVLPAHGTQGVSSSTNTPGSLYGAATWTDNAGNLWLFGGYCVGYGYSNDVWKYTISTNEWTWVKGPGVANQYGNYGTVNTASSTNNPGGRYLCESWVDNSGNFWMFGGAGYSAASAGYLSDLWQYNPTTNTWTWMKGSNAPNVAGSYGTMASTQSTNTPGGRYGYATFKDNSGHLWLFGGYGYAATTSTVGDLNDLWMYDISSGNWTWMKGSNQLSQTAVYGTATVPSSTNDPGARRSAASWTDANGDFWIFGGYGSIASSTLALTNDLWKYTVSTGNWTWMRGSSSPNSFGWYGSLNVPASNNDPGARYYATACGRDNLGNLWLFGGYGYSASSASRLNDLWRYDISANQWTWMKGSSSPNQVGLYGTMTVPSSTNAPGSRYLAASWMDPSGLIWIYGGYGYTSFDIGYMNDMWRYDLCNAPTSPTNTGAAQNMSICSGSSATLTAAGSATISWYASATSTTALGSGSTFITPTLSSVGTTSIFTYYAESYSCSSSASRTAFNVTVNPTPTLSVNSGTVCSGSPFVMIPSGAMSYTYSGGSQVVFPSTNSNYTITGTSAQGCLAQQPAISQVTVYALPSISANSGTLCNGSSFVIVPSGAMTYTVSGGSSTVSPSTSTFYLVSGTSSLGCVSLIPAVSNVIVFQGSPITVNSGSVCPGNSFTMNPSGAVSSFSYSGGSAIVSPTITTNYTVSGTNSVGCVSSAISTVNVFNPPVIAVNGGSVCIGNSLTLTLSGAASYTFSSGSPVVSPTTTTSYFVTGTSTDGCVSAQAGIATVTVYNLPTITVSGGTICAGLSFTLTPSGATSYTFSAGQVVSPTVTSTYSVFGSSVQGCISSSPATATVVVTPQPAISVNSGTICEGNMFTMTPSGASTYTYSSGSPNVSPNITTTYTVIGTNGAGCISSSAISTVVVMPSPVISVNSGSICSGSQFTISPSGAQTYTISGGTWIVSPFISTNYSVSGTGTNGCVSATTAIASVVVYSIPVITVNSGTTCSGNSFTLAPSGAASYTFSGGSAIVTPTASASYTVIGSNAAGCVSSAGAVANITVIPRPVISVASGNICVGNSFTLSPSGASTYTYSSGSPVVSPTVTGTYTVTGSDAFGCIAASPAIATVAVSQTLMITANSGTMCSGNSFTLSPSGASTYTYSSGSNVVTPSVTSTYTVAGTSSAGCISTPVVVTVAVLASPVISVNSGSICAGNSFVMLPSGAASYTFSSGSATVTPALTSSYSVAGTSTNGCISNAPAVSNVIVNSLPVIAVAGTAICQGQSYTLSPSGASTYTFTGGGPVVSPSVTTTYSVNGTSVAGCVSPTNALVTITVNPLPVISAANGTICRGASFTITPNGASTYTISGGTYNVSPTTTAIYSVTGTSTAGCVSAAPALVTVNVTNTFFISMASGSVCPGSNFTLTPSGASTYTISGGTAIVNPTVTTVYSVTGTSSLGCLTAAPATATVTVLSPPVISVNSGTMCAGANFSMNPTGAVSYTISGGTSVVSPTASSNYTVVGTGTNGCISSAVVSSVLVVPLPVIAMNSGSVCQGNSFLLSPSGAATYTFAGGGPSVTPSATSVYSVIGTGTTGCISGQTTATVTVYSLPTVVVNNGTICPGGSFTFSPTGATSYTYSGGSAIVSPTSTSVYTIVGSSPVGCLSSPASVTVGVNPSIVITISGGSVCAGQSFTLSPTGANSYTFSSGTNIVTPSITTAYSVTGSSSGCINTVAAVAVVSVMPLPVVSVNSGTICSGSSFTFNPSGAVTYSYSGGNGIVSPTVTTSYSINGTDNLGCISTPVIATVVVNGLPVISAQGGSICAGSTFTIVASGAVTYSYSSGSNTVNPPVNTSYTISGTDSNGCEGSAIITVSVDALPVLSISPTTTMICTGESLNLSASGASTYSWSVNGTAAGASATLNISPPSTSTIVLNGQNPDGCGNSMDLIVKVQQCEGLANTSGREAVSVYPNPNEGKFYVVAPMGSEIIIFNDLGQTVMRTVTSDVKEEIDMGSIVRGIYLVKVGSGMKPQTFRMIRN